MSSSFGFNVDLFTLRATAIMYMRRCGIPFQTIGKLTGHTNLESLIKHYDLSLEVGEPLALTSCFISCVNSCFNLLLNLLL